MPDLATLLAAIPLANDGNLITPDYHNSIRAAIAAIVAQLQQTPVSGRSRISVPPALLPEAPAAAWQSSTGFVTTGGQAAVSGWTPIRLPQGGHIESMNVQGSLTGTFFSLDATFGRQSYTDTPITTLIAIHGDVSHPFTFNTDVPFDTTGLTPSTIEDRTLIDNEKYKYLVTLELTGATATTNARIYGVQVTCRNT